MSKPMTMQEFVNVTKHVLANNSPFNHKVRNTPVVKYIDPHIDCRFSNVFSITFRSMGGGETVFHCMNEFRDIEESLYDRVMTWLTTPKE
ncbi:hypothetical protein RsoM2USA_184 [Ralstonia phage RsoM2USA]|nr:hypothetical protein RsoM2USA_184 [Ralstonia phage RsoM2USA]